ncbi:hypothetical protein CEXT_275241 [Caerostris extrusa]|uniref:Uncharacterized protein n=1 Tax=Caerostris extrusa TaxID=172846 RepID=A0AAV4XTB2_CAEEX|nr:hypothetical protein CEXT_275241 [Caerostris extrusa]
MCSPNSLQSEFKERSAEANVPTTLSKARLVSSTTNIKKKGQRLVEDGKKYIRKILFKERSRMFVVKTKIVEGGEQIVAEKVKRKSPYKSTL